MATRCYLFDLDGTLADCTHRLHRRKHWRAFFAACTADSPIPIWSNSHVICCKWKQWCLYRGALRRCGMKPQTGLSTTA
jgi:hypothetical protein